MGVLVAPRDVKNAVSDRTGNTAQSNDLRCIVRLDPANIARRPTAMTIAISIRVGEGLVYAADSTSTIFETINGVSVLAQSYHHAQKLMQISELPVGVLTFGLGLIGTRNLESLLSEYESEVRPVAPAIDERGVRAVADGLRTFLGDRYDQVFPPPGEPLPGVDAPADPRPMMGVVVGGYSGGSFSPEEYVRTLPARTIEPTRPPDAGDFGVRWWGQTVALQRLLLGFDQDLMQYLVENGVEHSALPGISAQLQQRLGWKVSFDGMPLQDAIDLAVYLTNVAIGHSRFAIGPPVCGGHVDVATISHRGYRWIRQKELRVKSDSAFF